MERGLRAPGKVTTMYTAAVKCCCARYAKPKLCTGLLLQPREAVALVVLLYWYTCITAEVSGVCQVSSVWCASKRRFNRDSVLCGGVQPHLHPLRLSGLCSLASSGEKSPTQRRYHPTTKVFLRAAPTETNQYTRPLLLRDTPHAPSHREVGALI